MKKREDRLSRDTELKIYDVGLIKGE